MSEAKFTSGPWHFNEKLTASENHRGFTIWDAKSYCVADVMPRNQDGAPGRANAHLIAAGPEMYEALRKCADEFRFLGRPRIAGEVDRALRAARGEEAQTDAE